MRRSPEPTPTNDNNSNNNMDIYIAHTPEIQINALYNANMHTKKKNNKI